MSSHTASGCTPGLPHFLETECCGQAVQIPKQAPEGSCWGLLDSLEHTDFSPLAAWKPLLPLAGPGDVVLPPRLIWIWKLRDLRAPARGLRTGT